MEKPLILIVDDVPQNIQVLGTNLRNKNYEIAVAQNGKQALQVAEEIYPDLILLDIMMPEMDGYEVCERLKEKGDTKDIPVILLTGKTETEDILKGFEVGAADYITKPYNSAELLARVKTHLELKQSRNELRKKNNELIKLNEHKNTFFSMVSHDLRNPLMGFLNLAEILKDDYDNLDDARVKQFINLLYDAADEMQKLLGNLLEWSRLEMGKIQVDPENIDLNEIITNNVNLFKTNAREKSITIKQNTDDEIKVYADKNMVDAVIRNVLSNSIKFTNDGGIINITSNSKNGSKYVSIKDNGIGMPKKTLDNLFSVKNINSSKGTRNEKGTGLGLLLCKQMLDQNNGVLNVESEQGKGTNVQIILPANKN
ncbi:MAG TPA: hybrid sensor histidine kinase/response regulator [Balneolales bacterium]|nr:hybrid sensor histidine kinase/response regulator [Balneolales bacterium]